LAVWSKKLLKARVALDTLITAIETDGRHEAGELWLDLRTAIAVPSGPLGQAFTEYRSTFEKVLDSETTQREAWTVFATWCSYGAPIGRYWIGWSGIDWTESPLAEGPAYSPFTVVWAPSWPLPSAQFAAIAAAAYAAQFPRFTPALPFLELSLGKLRSQKRWLDVAEDAAQAVIASSERLGPVPGPSGGRPIEKPLIWLLQQGHRAGGDVKQIADRLYQDRDSLPNWRGLTRETIKKRLADFWKRYASTEPIDL
jgi:hypothetical protein